MTKNVGGIALVVVLVALPIFAADGEATEYFADSSCSTNGNGIADSCASSTGGPGAFRELQACFSALRAGDTCLIKNGAGTYVTTNGQGRGDSVGFAINRSGTAGAPITVRNFPGHFPTLAACADGVTSLTNCDRATLTMYNQSHVRVTGFKVRGLIEAFCDAPADTSRLCTGIEIDHMEVVQGYSNANDGNWSGIWLEYQTGARLHHNYVHNLSLLSGSGTQGSAACLKLFTSVNGVYEYNSCDTINIDSAAGCFDDKQDSVGNTWRYNYCANAANGLRVQNQASSVSGLPRVATNTLIYQNVFVMGSSGGFRPRACLRFEARGFNGIDFYNNVCAGFATGHYVMSQESSGNVRNVRLWNNAFIAMGTRNIESFQDDYLPTLQNYNAYTGGRGFALRGGEYSSLAEFSSATSLDRASLALTDFGFISSTDYHLAAVSPLRGAGRVGGSGSGVAVDIGAYVNGVSCVGHRCSAEGSTVRVPSAPTGLRIIR